MANLIHQQHRTINQEDTSNNVIDRTYQEFNYEDSGFHPITTERIAISITCSIIVALILSAFYYWSKRK